MARFVSTDINRPPLSAAAAGVVVADVMTAAVPVTLAANDIAAIGVLGAGQEIVDAIFFSTDLDTNGTATITGTVGILNAAGTDLESGGNLITAADAGKAATINRMNVATAPLLAASDSDREVGFKCTTAAATKAAGVVGLQLFSRSA